jgi:hypothetical protein
MLYICRRLIVAAIGVFVFAPIGHAADAISGYGLFRSTGSNWAWDPAQVTGPIVSGDEVGHLVFTLPRTVFKSWPDNARVGVVSGMFGTPARCWVSRSKPFQVDPNVQSPWASNLISGSALYLARLAGGGEGEDVKLELRFDSMPSLRSAWDLYLLIDIDGSDKTGFLAGDYLIQNVSLGNGDKPGLLAFHWLAMRPEIGTVGQEAEVSVVVQNSRCEPMTSVIATLDATTGLAVSGARELPAISLRPFESKRVSWKVGAARPGEYRLRVRAASGQHHVEARPWISFVTARDPRHEFQTVTGDWLPFPKRPTLQAGNMAALESFNTLTSGQLQHNLFGITAHLPRSTNDEDPYAVANAVDGDPATCWASRWWRIAVPREPEWLEVDLGSPAEAAEVRFLPAWKNSGAPAALTVQVSANGKKWDTVLDETEYKLQKAPEADPLRYGEVTWQRIPFAVRSVRHVRFEARRLNQGATSFFCAPFEPFQFRVAEVALFNPQGQPVRPKGTGKLTANASTVHNAWYNSPAAISQTWPLMFKSGVKLNRIGQWGDKIDWATVEKTKGKYIIDPEVDRAIDESVHGGIDILMTLNYGNNLYQKVPDPIDAGPTWVCGHPFLQCAPTTPEALEAWARYCGFMAGHFKGRVKYFEIWNEENGWFFDSWAGNNTVPMVRKYGQALLAAAKAVRQAAPEAKIVFGGTAGMTLDFPRIALDEGAGPLIDVFAFHPYGHPMPEAAASHFLSEVNGKMEWQPRAPEIKDYEGEIVALRKLLHKYNPQMQIWADEMNWFAPGEPPSAQNGDGSELSQAKYLARFFAMNAAVDCGAIWWSLYNANGVQEWAVVRSWDLTPRAAFFASGCTSTVLDNVHPVADLRPEVVAGGSADLVVKAYRSGQDRVVIGLWRAVMCDDACTPAPVTIRLPQAVQGPIQLLDAVYGCQQPVVVRDEKNGAILADLLVGDWPLFVQASVKPRQ